MNKKGILASGLFVALFSQAEEGIALGEFYFSPFLDAQVVYDDNIYQAADEEEDIYGQYDFGAHLSRSTDTISFDSCGWFSQRMYDDHDEKDGDRGGLAAMLRLDSDKSFLSVAADVRQVDDYDEAPAAGTIPAGFEGTVDRPFDRSASNERRRLVDGSFGGGYQLSDSLGLMSGYKYYGVKYDEDGLDNWDEHVLGGEVTLKATDKAFLFANGQVGLITGDGAPDGEDAEIYTGRLGIKNELTDKSTIRLGVGATHLSTDTHDYTEPSFDANLLWRATDKVILFANGHNEIQPVGDGSNSQLSTRASTGVRFNATRALSVVVSGSCVYDKYEDDVLLANGTMGKAESVTKIGTLRLNLSPVEGLDLFGQVEYTDADDDIGDDYERMRGTLGAGYKF